MLLRHLELLPIHPFLSPQSSIFGQGIALLYSSLRKSAAALSSHTSAPEGMLLRLGKLQPRFCKASDDVLEQQLVKDMGTEDSSEAYRDRELKKLDKVGEPFLIDAALSLTQQLQDITDRELALTSQLKLNADHEADLQHQLERRNKAVHEARQITKELHHFMSTTNNITTKPAKITRIVEPSAANSKTVGSEMSGQTDLPMQEDYARKIDLTGGSDFSRQQSSSTATFFIFELCCPTKSEPRP